MSFLGKVYTYQSHENFDAYLKATGLPDDVVTRIVNEKTTQKIVKNGDSYIITQTNSKENKDTTFKSGVEFEEAIGGRVPVKVTYNVDGNTVTRLMTTAEGKNTFKYEFNGDDLVVYVTGDGFDGVAKRFYKA